MRPANFREFLNKKQDNYRCKCLIYFYPVNKMCGIHQIDGSRMSIFNYNYNYGELVMFFLPLQNKLDWRTKMDFYKF